jgi:hypothetical protein
MDTLRVEIIDEAATLVSEMASLCLEYQEYVSDPLFSSVPDGAHLEERMQLANECAAKFRVHPAKVAASLEVAGYDDVAESLHAYADTVNRFSLLTICWDGLDDISCLEEDVVGPRDHILELLNVARNRCVQSEGIDDARLATLLKARDLIGNLGRCTDDYLFYFEGLRDANEDPDEENGEITNEVHMGRITDTYEKLPTVKIIQLCATHGLTELASAIEKLSEVVSEVVHLPANAYPSPTSDFPQPVEPDDLAEGEQIDVEDVARRVNRLHSDAVSVLLRDRIGFL